MSQAPCGQADFVGAFSEFLAGAARVLVTCHANPDGDAVGSLLGMARILELVGVREVVAYCPDGIPDCYAFLAGADRVQSSLPAGASFDLTVTVDVADPALLGPDVPPWDRCGSVVVLDHHLRFKTFGDLVCRDPRASATGVLLWRLWRQLGLAPDRALGECLWCALYTDTGGFRYSSTNSEALRMAAELVEWGVDPWHMAVEIFESNPPTRITLLAEVLSTLQLLAGGKVATITVTEEMLARAGLGHAMLDTFINYPRSIRGVEVAIQFAERDGGVKVSLRSKGRVDVSVLAERFGGGGHRNAAGCRLETDIETAKARVLAEAVRLVAPEG